MIVNGQGSEPSFIMFMHSMANDLVFPCNTRIGNNISALNIVLVNNQQDMSSATRLAHKRIETRPISKVTIERNIEPKKL